VPPAALAQLPIAAPRERPAIFGRPTWKPESLAAKLFESSDEELCRRRVDEIAESRLGDFARALTLFTERERARLALLVAFLDALTDIARADVSPAERIDNLNRVAYRTARALRGEPTPSAFLRLFAAEARRRSFTRHALDEVFASARTAAASPRPESGAELDVRARELGEAVATALLGAAPTPAVVDLAAGLLRLGALQRLSLELARHTAPLPESELAEPVQYRTEDELAAAVSRECGALHNLLLKGARAVGEVPLTFRRPVAFALPVAIALLGLIEERPRAIARGVRRVGTWKLRLHHWRASYTPLG
jgi:hypothetical protein